MPAVHVIVAPVSAIPPSAMPAWRAEVTVNETYASAPKKANVARPRTATAAGSPRVSRMVPGGTSRTNARVADDEADRDEYRCGEGRMRRRAREHEARAEYERQRAEPSVGRLGATGRTEHEQGALSS